MDVEEAVAVADNPEFQFLVCVGEEPRSQVFGPSDKRNWVLWNYLSMSLRFRARGLYQ